MDNPVANTVEEEAERRLSMLFSDLLTVATKNSVYVSVVSTTEIMMTSRYAVDGRVYEITQSISLNYGTRERT